MPLRFTSLSPWFHYVVCADPSTRRPWRRWELLNTSIEPGSKLNVSQQCTSAVMKANKPHTRLHWHMHSQHNGGSYYSPLLSTCEATSRIPFTVILCPVLALSIGERKTNWKESRGSLPQRLGDCSTLHELRLRELGLYSKSKKKAVRNPNVVFYHLESSYRGDKSRLFPEVRRGSSDCAQ